MPNDNSWESLYPLDYREDKVERIMSALSRCPVRSICVLGLAGMGKSNVIRFVVFHKPAQQHHLHEKATSLVFVHVDCNGLQALDELPILERLSRKLADSGIPATWSIPVQPTDQAHALREMQNVLHSQFENIQPALNVAVSFDPFDEVYAQLSPAFFPFLRALRDHRKNVAYILASRRPIPPMRELQELFDDPCWIGPLNSKDAQSTASAYEIRLSAQAQQALFEMTGGHPGLLKNVGEWLSDHSVDLVTDMDALARQLLTSTKIQDQCKELWASLTENEQQTLALRVTNVEAQELDSECISFLRQAGVLGDGDDGEPVIFSRLFARFVESAARKQTIRVEVCPLKQVKIQSWTGTDTISLADLPFKTLSVLVQIPGRLWSKKDLSDAVYGYPALEPLERLITRLREELNPILRRLTGDPKYNCIVAEHGSGYYLEAKAANGRRVEFRSVAST